MLKYQQIANQLEQYIEMNQLNQGDKLPVLEKLMQQFEASKSTVTKALDFLEKKGLIFQVRGSGIFVRRQKREGYINLLGNQGFKKDLAQFQLTSDILAFEVINPCVDIATQLNIEMTEEVYYLKRIRYINGQRLCLEESFYNKSIVRYLNKEIVSDSIFDYITEGLGLKVGFSDMYLHVGKLNKSEADYLHLVEGEPKLYVETLFHLTNGLPFDFSKLTYNYQQSQFFIQANNHFL